MRRKERPSSCSREMGLRETSVLLLVCVSSERRGSDTVHTCVITPRNVLILVGLLQAPVRQECDLGIILLVQTDETTWPLLKNSGGMDFYLKQLITQLKILVKMHFVNVTYYPPETINEPRQRSSIS